MTETIVDRPTVAGVHKIELKEGEKMLCYEHNDPFRTHYYEGPLFVKLTVYTDGGACSVWGWAPCWTNEE